MLGTDGWTNKGWEDVWASSGYDGHRIYEFHAHQNIPGIAQEHINHTWRGGATNDGPVIWNNMELINIVSGGEKRIYTLHTRRCTSSPRVHKRCQGMETPCRVTCTTWNWRNVVEIGSAINVAS